MKHSKIKKTYIFLLVVNFLITTVPAAILPPDIKRIREKNNLTVAMYYDDIPPFFMKDKNGTLSGFDVDLARDIGARLKVKVEFIRTAKTFNDVINQVSEKKADLGISMLSNTLGRAQLVAFTDTYIVLKKTLVINRTLAAQTNQKQNIISVLNNQDIVLGVLDGSSYLEYSRDNFQKASIMLFENSNMMFNAVLQGKIFGLFTDNIDVKNWYDSKPESSIYLQTIIMKEGNDPLAIAVNWEDRHLLLWLNFYLKAIADEGTLAGLKKQYSL